MALYMERYINNSELKKWVSELSVDNIEEVNIAGKLTKLDKIKKEILRLQLSGFVQGVHSLKDGDDWRDLLGICSMLFYDAFFKVNNNAIKIANYYECLVIASDLETKKKLVKGFDYLDIGAVNLYDGKKVIGCIGQKSDLLWSVLYNYFILEDEYGGITHTIPNHEEYMSIQLINVEKYNIEEIEHYVNEILLRCSVELCLNFKVVELDNNIREVGNDRIFELQVHKNQYEYIPLMYLNNALHSSDVRMAYLSYYQVLEYFFNRTQNYQLFDELNAGGFLTAAQINHRELKSVMKKYVNSLKEKESLKLVINKCLNVNNFKNWISKNPQYNNQYTQDTLSAINVDMSKSDEKIIGKIAERIYYFRCAIAHAKGDADEYLAIPEQSDAVICRELPLLKLIAIEALTICSEV